MIITWSSQTLHPPFISWVWKTRTAASTNHKGHNDNSAATTTDGCSPLGRPGFGELLKANTPTMRPNKNAAMTTALLVATALDTKITENQTAQGEDESRGNRRLGTHPSGQRRGNDMQWGSNMEELLKTALDI